MPTGYTAPVKDGTITSFNAFAWRCARAFGALIEMRDRSLDAPIPETVERSSYNTRYLAELQKQLADLDAMTPTELERHVAKLRAETIARNAEYAAEHAATQARYSAMLAEVEAWTPPTAEHVGLKEFMREQLLESIRFDCGGEPYQSSLPGPAGDWLAQRRSNILDSIESCRERAEKEAVLENNRDEWLKALRESVPYERPVSE